MPTDDGNAASYFVDRHEGEGRRDKAAFVEGDRALSYGNLIEGTDRVAGMLSRHGFRREDRVAMLVHDVLEFPLVFWGCLKAGVIPIPLNTLLTAEQYEFILADSRVRGLVIANQLLDPLRKTIARTDALETVFVIGGDPAPFFSFATEFEASERVPAIDVSGDEVAFWLYSSGSTGAPKGVRHVHASLKGTTDTYGARVLGIRKDDVAFSAAKLFFAYGLGNGMSFPLSVGATTVLLPGRPTPEAVATVMKETEPTIFFCVPTLYAAILASAVDGPIPGADRLRLAVSAGEALPEEIGTRWSAKTGTEILDGVGSTEMLHIYLSNSPGNVVYGTSGTAVPGYEVRLVDEEGHDVGIGDVGELLVSGQTAADGYWNNRAKTRATFEGNWTRTGDKYTRRDDGRYVYCGRTDDMFKVSGVWLSPFEVEQALLTHPGVLEAAVVAKRDEHGLEKPKAFLVLKDGKGTAPCTDDIKAHVQASVGPQKYPRWIEIVDELPKTATGKIQRFRLLDAG
ncbi:MAG: benzoate-CoA ligase family protein [Pseudomonadota bacterium]